MVKIIPKNYTIDDGTLMCQKARIVMHTTDLIKEEYEDWVKIDENLTCCS